MAGIATGVERRPASRRAGIASVAGTPGSAWLFPVPPLPAAVTSPSNNDRNPLVFFSPSSVGIRAYPCARQVVLRPSKTRQRLAGLQRFPILAYPAVSCRLAKKAGRRPRK